MNDTEARAEYRRFTREELYELVWSEPMTTIARRYQMSLPAFARICSRLNIPRPERGYWAKRQAGKRVRWAPLPARRPGQAQYLGLGDVNHENLGRVIPETPPAFPDDLDLIEQSAKRSVGRVKSIPPDDCCHPAVRTALEEQGPGRGSTSTHPWRSERPATMEAAWEGRALALLNSLFWAWDRVGGEAKVVRGDGLGAQVRFSWTTVRLSVSRVVRRGDRPGAKNLCIAVDEGRQGTRAGLEWSDGIKRLERQLGDIAVRVVVAAEEMYREYEHERHELFLEVYRESQEMERVEVERQRERDAKALFEGAAEHRRAGEIRAFVDAVRAGEATCSDQARVSLDEWTAWARNIADEIDPALSNPYLK